MRIGNLLLILAIGINGGAYAASLHGDENHRHETNAQAKQEGSGVVKGVNTVEGKVKIAHEAIPSLGWPAMTMWFPVRGALPSGIREGDSVRFELQQENGKWVITRIESRK